MQRYNNEGIDKILFLTIEYVTGDVTGLTDPKLLSIKQDWCSFLLAGLMNDIGYKNKQAISHEIACLKQ